MKKLLALLLCGTLSLSALTGCGAKEEAAEMPAQTLEEGSEEAEGSSEADATGEGTINHNGKNKMAMFGPLTGDNLQYGVKIKNGAELALNQFNEEHGTDFTIEFMDDKGDPNEAVNLANKIISDDTVFCALAGYGSSCAMATAPVFDEADMLLMGVAASNRHSQCGNQAGKLRRLLFAELPKCKAVNTVAQKSCEHNADAECKEKMNPCCSVE